MSEYSVYKRFNDPALAKQYRDALREKGVECILVDNSPYLDITFSGNSHHDETELKVRSSDFARADAILETAAQEEVVDVDHEHYLFEFDDEELYEVLLKKDEWSEFDYMLAQRILTERGHNVDTSMLQSLNKRRLEDLSKPSEGQKLWIYVGYGISFLGGMAGVIIGWYLWKSMKTLPNGHKVPMYREKDRLDGKSIFYLGIICAVIWISMGIWTFQP